uniref:Uncharacterized protein n=1 Tax=Romanomermis culicivorax TaxID=13658 RepID=A0A915IZF9_ROMCU
MLVRSRLLNQLTMSIELSSRGAGLLQFVHGFISNEILGFPGFSEAGKILVMFLKHGKTLFFRKIGYTPYAMLRCIRHSTLGYARLGWPSPHMLSEREYVPQPSARVSLISGIGMRMVDMV